MSAKSAATGKVTATIKFVFPYKATPDIDFTDEAIPQCNVLAAKIYLHADDDDDANKQMITNKFRMEC